MNASPNPFSGMENSPSCQPAGWGRLKRRLLLLALGGTGVLLIGALAGAAYLLSLVPWITPFLRETGLSGWIALTASSVTVTAGLAWWRFARLWRRSPGNTSLVWAMLMVSIGLGAWVWHQSSNALVEFLPRVVHLNLPVLPAPVTTYYADGAKARAERLQADVRDMNAFYQERLGVQADVTLAVLNSNQWARVNPIPFGLPGVLGVPHVVFMPAHSGGWTFHQMRAREGAIPADVLQDYLRTTQKTLEAASDDFVDFIALHELGHVLLMRYGIDPGCHWLNEFLASYLAYAYVAERRPERKPVIALLGRPSVTRPRHTTLADLERLYFRVDDYGWYQGMFERRIQEMYPNAGLRFIAELRRQRPRPPTTAQDTALPEEVLDRIAPERALQIVEAIAPGFQAWAEGFGN